MKKIAMTFCISLVIVLALTVCQSSANKYNEAGRNFDSTHANDIKPGMDKKQILEWFGEPYTKSESDKTMEDGKVIKAEAWVYVYAVGNPAGKSKAKSLAVVFGADNKVISSGYSDDFK